MSSPESSISLYPGSEFRKRPLTQTERIGETYKQNVQADFQIAAREAGLGTEDNPYPIVTLHVEDDKTSTDFSVEEPGILVNLPYNGFSSRVGVVGSDGVLHMVRTHEGAPDELYVTSEAELHLYADPTVRNAVVDAIRHAANPELATEEY